MKFILFVAAFFITTVLSAQDFLIVRSEEKGLYVEHEVVAKQTFYAIGKLYNVSAKDIAAYNEVEMTTGLQVGQVLKIPLKKENFSQESSKGVPVYYEVAVSEGLYRISVNNNKVPIEKLREWNGLKNDNVVAGSRLVIGYLTGGTYKPNVLISDEELSVKKENATPPTQEEKINNKAELKEETKNTSKPIQQTNTSSIITAPRSSSLSGFFKKHFDQQVKVTPITENKTVTAGIFKTSSGWQDAKYYMLIDKVEPGTIIRIINPSNNSAVYAKVLGEMSGIRQNQGLNIRISNAAASALGIDDMDKFIVKVNY